MFDERCKDLAEVFLEDENPAPQRVNELAQVIQDAIENWLSANSLEHLAPTTEG